MLIWPSHRLPDVLEPPALRPESVRPLQHKLLDAIHGQPRHAPFHCAYGFVLHARAERRGQCFGIITPAGESLRLTDRLLFTLGLTRSRLRGGTGISLGAAGEVEEADAPVGRLRLVLVRCRPGVASPVRVTYELAAGELPRPALLLSEHLPLGWPA